MKCVDADELMRLASGQLESERAELVHVHMAHCAGCAARRDELAVMTARLRPDPGEFDAAAVSEVMALIRMGKADRPESARPSLWRAWQTWFLLPATAAATAAVMLLFWPQPQPLDAGFQARGGAAMDLDRWVSLQVFRASPTGYEPVTDSIAPDDALAFTYLNHAPEPLHFLTVLAVDARGRLFWYYSPSVPIQQGSQPFELPEQVQHDLAPGALRIFALFSAEPLSRPLLEERVKAGLREVRAPADLTRLGLSGVGQHSLRLEVRPAREAP
jgi:hypothetical protein